MDRREKRKEEAKNNPTIKAVTKYKLHDPATYHKKNLRVKTNKKVFRVATPESERATPIRGTCTCQSLIYPVVTKLG